MAPAGGSASALVSLLVSDIQTRDLDKTSQSHGAVPLNRRALEVDHTQAVTLGVCIVYVVVIALLWNLPYIRWVLWPFKVRSPPPPFCFPCIPYVADSCPCRCSS
jgi:hypothetical protein